MKKEIIDASFVNGRSLVEGKIYGNTYTALKCLIDGSYCTQQTLPSSLTEINYKDRLDYWKEFCTIRMATSRRSGHTTAICKIAQSYFNSAIFLSPNLDVSRFLCEAFKKRYDVEGIKKITKNTRDTILTKDGGYFFRSYRSIDGIRGIDCEAIIIDPACLLKPKEEDKIYRDLGPCMHTYLEKFFIFVG